MVGSFVLLLHLCCCSSFVFAIGSCLPADFLYTTHFVLSAVIQLAGPEISPFRRQILHIESVAKPLRSHFEFKS